MYFYLDLCNFHFVVYWKSIVSNLTNVLNTTLDRICAYTLNAVEHFLLAVLLYISLCFLLYKLINCGYGLRYERKFPNAKRVLFVIAHPDDECMFFGPTIYKLTDEGKSQVYLLCLSTGNKDGLGQTRKKELWSSCQVLGIKESNVFIYNCTVLPDNPKIRWREDVVAQIILHYVESLEIDTLITFDKHGVSKHSNHCSIYYSVAYLSMEKRIPNHCKIYTLESINILRKYWLMLDMPISFVLSTHRFILKWAQRNTIMNAMRQHKSQYVWFRKLYIRFSRYIIINTFQQLDMIDLELDLTIDD